MVPLKLDRETSNNMTTAEWIEAPLRVEQGIWLDAPVEDVFSYVTSQAHLCDFVPGLHKVEIRLPDDVTENKEHAQRICDFGNDMFIQEIIVLWEPPFRQGYHIAEPNPFGLYDHLAVMTSLPAKGGTEIQWQHHYNHADPPAIETLLTETFTGVTSNLVSHFGGESAVITP